MGCVDEIKSGQFNIYGQWGAYASIIFLIIFCIANLINISRPLQIFISLAGLFFALVILLLEVPFFTKCCPVSERVTKVADMLRKNQTRGLGYVAMATIMWLHTIDIFGGANTLIIPSLALTFTAFCYVVAAFKKEERQTSGLVGGAAAAMATRI